MCQKITILFIVKYSGDEYAGIMAISSLLKQKGYQAEIVKAEYKKIRERMKDNDSFFVLAYSAPTALVDYYLGLNRALKEEFNFFSAFGGAHPTAVPEMIEEAGVDGVCIGEGEFAMLELVDNLGLRKSLRNIRNWWVKENNEIFKNPIRPLISDLDRLPLPDRDLFKGQKLFDREKVHITTGRGCPYRCSYCFHSYYNRLYKGQAAQIRKRSVNKVIKEIKNFKDSYPLKFVFFDDDIFILPMNWLKNFSRQYKKFIDLPFFCYLRPDLVNEEVVRYLKIAGCYSVSMGLEVADDYLRNNILKRQMSKERIISAAETIKRYGIRLKTSNIIGVIPGDIEKDVETIRFNVRCRVDYSSVEQLKIYPKTEISNIIANYSDADVFSLPLKNRSSNKQIDNLKSLFACAVEYPFLLRFMKFLIRLPLGRLYKILYLFWEGYCAYFRLYPAGKQAFFRGIRKYVYLLNDRLVK